MNPDVIVVGAGPAGSAAARALAVGGVRVRLLERARFPRNKPCGGGLTARALRRFPWLPPALARITTHTVSRLYLEGPSGDHVVLTSREPAVLLVRRIEFDALLAGLAVDAGAELVENALVSQVREDEGGVEVTTRSGDRHHARFLVAADGVNGVVTRRLGLHPGWDRTAVALDLMEEAPVARLRARDPATLWVSYGYRNSSGYGYIFPKRDHVNVGVGYLRASLPNEATVAPFEIQQQFVASLLERKLLEGASCREDFTPCHLPVGGPIERTARGRVLVAGDAGGFVNAYTAEGIYYAMASGELAGQAIAAAIAEGGPGGAAHAASGYERAWRREMGAELRDARLVQRFLFADPARMDAMVGAVRRHPEAAAIVVDYAVGTIGYRQARRRLLARFPGVAWALIRHAI